MSLRIRIGTRGSLLALTQARWVQTRLQEAHPHATIELVIIKTTGDRFLDQPLSTIGGKGLFVKEIEEAMLAHEIDCAVHSMKDVPNEIAAGLEIAAVPLREDARDVLIAAAGTHLADLPANARVGTSSLRRAALVQAQRPDLHIEPLRGNVDSRLRKVEAGALDAIILAAAGLRRLGLQRDTMQLLDVNEFLPAVGQGALAIQSRAETSVLLADLDDAPTRLAVTAERAFLQEVGGSCRTPLAAYAQITGNEIWLRALVASPDGRQVIHGEASAPTATADELGRSLGQQILARGGAAILKALGEADGR